MALLCLLLLIVASWAIVWIVAALRSRRTGFTITELIRMPSFTAMREEPQRTREAHRTYLIAMAAWVSLCLLGFAIYAIRTLP